MELSLENKNIIKQFIANKTVVDLHKIEDESNLQYDLKLDSLDEIEIIIDIEFKFDIMIEDKHFDTIRKVSDLYTITNNLIIEKQSIGRLDRSELKPN